MKGPARMPGATWGYRQWDRLLALNLKTDAYKLLPIPQRTSLARFSPYQDTPAFASAGPVVWVAVDDWLARLPADAGLLPASGKLAVLNPLPAARLAACQARALAYLNGLQQQMVVSAVAQR